VQVHCDEGIANHIGPEPCAGIREAVGEASVGERTGQPLSRDNTLSWVPTPFQRRKATQTDALSQASGLTRRGLRTWHVRTLLAREPGDLQSDRWREYRSAARIGKARSRSR
jgi:hypothetical protein